MDCGTAIFEDRSEAISGPQIRVCKAKKINKCFSGHFSKKPDEAGRLLFLFFIYQKTGKAIFFLIHLKLTRHLFCSL